MNTSFSRLTSSTSAIVAAYAGSGPSIASAVRLAPASLASSIAFAKARPLPSEPSIATRIRSNGIYATATRGWKKRWAIAVGTIAESTTTETRSENCVRSMMPAFNP